MAYLSYQLRGGEIARLRKNRMLTQAELAEAAGVCHNTVNRIEKGARAGKTTLKALADALGVTPLDLRA